MFRCKRMNTDNIWILFDELNNRIILFYLLFFGDRAFQRLLILHAYMPPKTKDLLTHRLLESVSKGEGDDHDSDTDRCCYNRETYNEPRKGFLTVKCDSIGYKACNLHWLNFVS